MEAREEVYAREVDRFRGAVCRGMKEGEMMGFQAGTLILGAGATGFDGSFWYGDFGGSGVGGYAENFSVGNADRANNLLSAYGSERIFWDSTSDGWWAEGNLTVASNLTNGGAFSSDNGMITSNGLGTLVINGGELNVYGTINGGSLANYAASIQNSFGNINNAFGNINNNLGYLVGEGITVQEFTDGAIVDPYQTDLNCGATILDTNATSQSSKKITLATFLSAAGVGAVFRYFVVGPVAALTVTYSGYTAYGNIPTSLPANGQFAVKKVSGSEILVIP